MQNSGPAVIGFGALITLFAMERGYISRLLSQPFLVLLGELSFGIYMLHGVLITYLGVNFPLAQSTAACCSFVLALCVAAHIMFECVEKPMRSWILSKSSCLLGTKSNTAPPRALNKPEQAQKWLGKRQLFLLAELLAFAAFVYFSLPTVNLVAASDAAQVAQESTVPNIILSPYIACIGAKAQLKGEQVSLSLVWKCLKDQSLNYTVNAVLLDGQGKRLGSLSYMQDGRRQFVKAGKCWIEHPVLKQGSAGIPSAISITVLRNKDIEALHTSAGQNESCSFSVPVQSY